MIITKEYFENQKYDLYSDDYAVYNNRTGKLHLVLIGDNRNGWGCSSEYYLQMRMSEDAFHYNYVISSHNEVREQILDAMKHDFIVDKLEFTKLHLDIRDKSLMDISSANKKKLLGCKPITADTVDVFSRLPALRTYLVYDKSGKLKYLYHKKEYQPYYIVLVINIGGNNSFHIIPHNEIDRLITRHLLNGYTIFSSNQFVDLDIQNKESVLPNKLSGYKCSVSFKKPTGRKTVKKTTIKKTIRNPLARKPVTSSPAVRVNVRKMF